MVSLEFFTTDSQRILINIHNFFGKPVTSKHVDLYLTLENLCIRIIRAISALKFKIFSYFCRPFTNSRDGARLRIEINLLIVKGKLIQCQEKKEHTNHISAAVKAYMVSKRMETANGRKVLSSRREKGVINYCF